MQKTMKLLRFWFPVVLYSGIIFSVSSVPNLRPPIHVTNFDKIVHAIEYGILGILLVRALSATNPNWPFARLVLWTVCLAVLNGASDEFHQSFVHGRECDIFDLLADTVGATVGACVYLTLILKEVEQKMFTTRK
jgi:VanZ family protein